jgi:hypothetical protein
VRISREQLAQLIRCIGCGATTDLAHAIENTWRFAPGADPCVRLTLNPRCSSCASREPHADDHRFCLVCGGLDHDHRFQHVGNCCDGCSNYGVW